MKMNIEETKEAIKVMQAYVDGVGIEFCYCGGWLTATTPIWNWEKVDFRIAKPKELTLEEKVKAKYPDYEVLMFAVNEGTGWLSYGFNNTNRVTHTTAQSDPRFQGYVYIHSENDWLVSNKPTKSSRNKYIQPIAVLFNKDCN